MKQTFTVIEGKSTVKEEPMTAGEFFLTLLHSGTNTHILHLQSRSYSEHKALQRFYEGIVDATDSIIEAWQGKNKQLVEYPDMYMPPLATGLDELNALSSFVQANRSVVGSDSELQNLVDEVQSLIDSTIYKLTFLK